MIAHVLVGIAHVLIGIAVVGVGAAGVLGLEGGEGNADLVTGGEVGVATEVGQRLAFLSPM